MYSFDSIICLIGEQPLANFIPILDYNPKTAILLYTNRTVSVCNRLKDLLTNKYSIKSIAEKIEAYEDISKISENIIEVIQKHLPETNNAIFNITGGTKIMSIGCYEAARQLKAPMCYLKSEDLKSYLFIYYWEGNILRSTDKEIKETLSLDDYLKLHVGTYSEEDFKNPFENIVCSALTETFGQKDSFEIKKSVRLTPSLEIDLILCYSNNFGIIEAKTGNKAKSKEAIDQLNTAGGREYLGTYTRKILVINCKYPKNNSALARERNIKVIELINSNDKGLDSADKQLLLAEISKELGIRD